MRNRRFSNYPDDADYTTNSPSYYDDLARKQKLIEMLAKKIWEYDETLDLTLEQITNRLEYYIEENDHLMSDRLEQWDLKLEKFPENVELLLQEWLSDGTLDHIINETIFNMKADQISLDETNEQLAQITYLFDVEESGVDDVADTTAINQAIDKAVEQGYKRIQFPKNKTFLIKPDRGGTDQFARGVGSITIPSDIWVDLNGCTLKISPNALPGYRVFEFGIHSKNSKISNGKLVGDRYEHDYVTIANNSTHEWGHGVYMYGENNVVENLEISQMTGDGVYMGGHRENNWNNRLFNTDFQKGSIDNMGNVDPTQTQHIVSKLLDFSLYSKNGLFNLAIEPYYGTEIGLKYDKLVQVAFYRYGEFLSFSNQLVMTEIIPPMDATHFRISFYNANIDFTHEIYVHSSKIARNNKIVNCHIHHNRRQGISTSKNENCKIIDNTIHDIDGTSPKAGIDVEDSRFTLNNLTIEGNFIYNTEHSCIILYDGFNVKVLNNILINNKNQDEIGALTTQYTKNIEVRGNLFYGEVRVGTKQTENDQYNRNVYDNNIAICQTYPRDLVFRNTTITNSTFTNYKRASFYNSSCENTRFEDMTRVASYFQLTGGVFKDCEFNIKHTDLGLESTGETVFIDCFFDVTKQVAIRNLNSFERNTVKSRSYSLTTNGDYVGVVSISGNKFLNHKTTSDKIVLNSPARIKENSFLPDPISQTFYLAIELNNRATLLYLEKNYQSSSDNASMYQIGGTVPNALIISEGNYSETTGSDFYFSSSASSGIEIKSKDDVMPNSTVRTSDPRVKRHTTTYE